MGLARFANVPVRAVERTRFNWSAAESEVG